MSVQEAYDCQACGACCTSPDENRREGVADWVEIRDGEPLLRHRDLVQRLVVVNPEGERHLRLQNHRCTALRGRLGHKVRCTIYNLRPAGCRRVTAGSERCLQYRAERGIGGS